MITINTILDMRPGAVPKIIHLSQYDSDFTLVFRLHASFGVLNIESGTTAEIRGTKKSGTGYSASATLNASNNTVTVAGDAQMTAVAGQNTYEIVLIKNNKVLGSANFVLLVERAALDADTITDASVLRELNAIVEGAETATQAAEEAEDAADRAEAAAESLEIDDTLTQTGQAADAKATGDEISDLKRAINEFEPLSDDIKTALLACFEHVMWIDDTSGQSAYDDLYAALYQEEPIIEPYYDISKIMVGIGGLGPDSMFTWENSTKTRSWKRLVNKNQLTNRASLKTVLPCTSGIITAQSGYQICVYEFDGIVFASGNYYEQAIDTRNKFGLTNGLNINYQSDPNVTPAPTPDTPAWVDSYTIENPNCKYVLIAFKKTDNSDWTQSELQNMYGTVYTAFLSPYYRLSAIADFKGGYSYTTGDVVKDETMTEVGFTSSHKRVYVKEAATNARAVSGFLPITSGILKSADTTKYQICVYQINFEGQIMWDINNPYVSATNGNPAWANEFDLSVSANKDDIFCVCISFKKLDGTEFTQEELSNMYGTVFTYEEVE